MSSDPETLLTEEGYLAIERQAEFRSEFYQGEKFAMAGASRRHNRTVTNLVTALMSSCGIALATSTPVTCG